MNQICKKGWKKMCSIVGHCKFSYVWDNPLGDLQNKFVSMAELLDLYYGELRVH